MPVVIDTRKQALTQPTTPGFCVSSLLLQKVLPKAHTAASSRSPSPVWYAPNSASSRPTTPATAPTPSRFAPGPAATTTASATAADSVSSYHRAAASGGQDHPWEATNYASAGR